MLIILLAIELELKNYQNSRITAKLSKIDVSKGIVLKIINSFSLRHPLQGSNKDILGFNPIPFLKETIVWNFNMYESLHKNVNPILHVE